MVVAADVDEVKPRPDLDAAVVRCQAGTAVGDRVGACRRLRREDAVRAAVLVVDAADLGDEMMPGAGRRRCGGLRSGLVCDGSCRSCSNCSDGTCTEVAADVGVRYRNLRKRRLSP